MAEQVATRCNQDNGFLAATSWQVCNMQGGSSEGCFAAKICPQVMEFGPVNAFFHKINEHVLVASLDPLKNIYKGVPERLAAV